MKRRQVGKLIRSHILPSLNDAVWIIWEDCLVSFRQELLRGVLFERSGWGSAAYLWAFVYPMMVPNRRGTLLLDFAERAARFAPDIPGGFELRNDAETARSFEQVRDVIHQHFLPLFDRILAPKDILALHDSSSGAPLFGSGVNHSGHGYWGWMAYIAAYCGALDRVPQFVARSREIIGEHRAPWVPDALAELTEIERLLQHPQALRERLASNAFEGRRKLNVPFPFDPSAYGLPLGWLPVPRQSAD